MAAGVIRPSWTSEERASYGAGTTGDSLMELVSAVANEELPDPRKEFLSLGKGYEEMLGGKDCCFFVKRFC